MRATSKRILFIALGIILIGGIVLWRLGHKPTLEELVVQAHAAIAEQNGPRAESLIRQILDQDPKHPDGLILAAVLAAELGQFEEAVSFCRIVPEESETQFQEACLIAGNVCVDRLGRISDGAEFFQRVLNREPDHLVANERMVYVLSLQTRAWELIPYFLSVLRQSPADAVKIQLLMQGDLAYPAADLIRKLRRSDPKNAGLALAEAHLHFLKKDFAAARKSCRKAIARDPDFSAAYAELGLTELAIGSESDKAAWRSSLPQSAMTNPVNWYVLGQCLLQDRIPQEAARCFWESLKLDPNSAGANYQLGTLLRSLGRESESLVFLDRAAKLEKYIRILESTGPDPRGTADDPEKAAAFLEAAQSAAEMAESLGLIWEAYSWSTIASQAPTRPDWARNDVKRFRPMLATLPRQRTAAGHNPAMQIDLTSFAIPRFGKSYDLEETRTDKSASPQDLPSNVSFSNDAKKAGLHFSYNNGSPKPRDQQWTPYDFTGGGVAVLDYDGDAWPDVFFTQGCDLNAQQNEVESPELADRIFRNHQGLQFSDRTAAAITLDVDYGQGSTSGDFDCDGFPDLLVANLGPNKLLHNNGDGTFSEFRNCHIGESPAWTTSCAVGDWNDDGLPDFYCVNYLAGDIRTHKCSDGEGRYGGCSPRDFPAAADELYINDGHGAFHEISVNSGIGIPDGKGLGVVACDFNGDRKTDLFVANDGVPNFLFLNQTMSGGDVRFVEAAVAHGVAVNSEGRPEACMGIVVEDFDNDHRADLFVTNFLDETNTIYHAIDGEGNFSDETSRSGLGIPSLKMLGFGVQAVDAELNGLLDLVIANGHVDSYPERNAPYRMRPQYFRNQGAWEFHEVSRGLGEWFEQQHLGRAMAKLDWNRDGAEDLVVTQLDEPVALLTNTTIKKGNSISIRLVSGLSDRDSIGAVVTVQAPDITIVRQVTSGDGFQCSNEHRLIFGLSNLKTASVTIEWKSGARQIHSHLTAGSEWIIVEGSDVARNIPR